MKNESLSLHRYQRQIIFSGLGENGQRRLSKSTAVIIGCGANGTVLANHLARAGVGHLRLVDRDYVELNNLHRQLLFDEEDVREGYPKPLPPDNACNGSTARSKSKASLPISGQTTP